MKKLILLACLTATVFFACKKNKTEDSTIVTDTDKKEVILNHANIVLASYQDSYDKVLDLKAKVETFTANPTTAGLENCKTAWKESRLPYLQTEAYRFGNGPIDDENGPEKLINSWPMDESYIDYVVGDATAGIINNPLEYAITKKSLENLNENAGETSISTGYHAIEFLLWGQDLSAITAGTRPYTNYVIGAGGTNANQARRALYLKTATDLLADNLKYLINEWKEGGAYRTKFTAPTFADNALTNMVRSLGSLAKGEMAGQRLAPALTNKDQEEEHSCFSDNSHIDNQYDIIGIENVYTGKYTRTNGQVISGKSLSDIFGRKSPTKNAAVLAQLKDAKNQIFLIPAPFDQAILTDPGNAISNSITSCRLLADKIADAAFDLGIKISF